MCCSVPVKSWSRTSSRKRRFCHRKSVVWDIFWWFKGWGTWYQIFGTNISIDLISRKLDRAKHSLHAQASWRDVHSTPCTAKRVPCTYREPCARLAFWSNRAEASLHVQASLLDVQSILCTIRHALVPPQKMLAPCKRSACELYRDHLLDPRSFFCLRKGQQILVECSPRPKVNVDVHS